ncbi:MAG TPA: sugar kinase [Casimicrobiaceae bacterium]|nr:sugar kinase [Casimicrobiaceae bacterium]
MPMPRFDMVAMGEPLLEFNQVRPEEPAGYRQGFGGDTSNAAIAASRLGARAAYITRLGNDAFGRMFLELWRREGVDASGVGIDADAPTGIYFVTHGTRGHEFSYLRAGSAASRMRPADLPLDLIRSAAALHVSGISQAISASACDSVFAAIDAARNAGVKICYDSNLRLKLWPLARARATITATMRLCDWFVPSLEEARQLSAVEDPQAILDWCHAEGAPVVALKMGAGGVWVSTAHGRDHIAGHTVHAVDATGAGDCFDGAFVTRLIAGDAPVQAACYANAAAAMATTGYGAVAPLPRHADVAAFLAKAA